MMVEKNNTENKHVYYKQKLVLRTVWRIAPGYVVFKLVQAQVLLKTIVKQQ